MKRKKQIQEVGRRDLLRLAGLGSAAGAAAVVVGSRRKAEAAVEDIRTDSGYRETEHVRTYYDLAKF